MYGRSQTARMWLEWRGWSDLQPGRPSCVLRVLPHGTPSPYLLRLITTDFYDYHTVQSWICVNDHFLWGLYWMLVSHACVRVLGSVLQCTVPYHCTCMYNYTLQKLKGSFNLSRVQLHRLTMCRQVQTNRLVYLTLSWKPSDLAGLPWGNDLLVCTCLHIFRHRGCNWDNHRWVKTFLQFLQLTLYQT